MEEFNNLNAGQICSIKSYPKSICFQYEYKEKKTYFFFWKVKEGFYNTYSSGAPTFTTKESIEEHGTLFCEGKRVFRKPHILIIMSNQMRYEKYFNTTEKLISFMEQPELKNVPWIKIL